MTSFVTQTFALSTAGAPAWYMTGDRCRALLSSVRGMRGTYSHGPAMMSGNDIAIGGTLVNLNATLKRTSLGELSSIANLQA